MDIKISSQFGEIGIRYNKSQLNINTTPPELEINQKLDNVNIVIENPQIQIDYKETRAEMGYLGSGDFAMENAREGIASAQNYISKVVQQGNSLAKPGKRGASIANIAWYNSLDHKEFGLDVIPRTPPKVSSTGGIEIKTQPGFFHTKAYINNPKIDGIPGSVDIYIEKEPKLQIETTDNSLDMLI